MQMPGGFELVIIVLVILLLFGAKRIPELARGLGQGMQEFRKASDDRKKENAKVKEDIDQYKRNAQTEKQRKKTSDEIKKEIDKSKKDINQSTRYTEKEKTKNTTNVQ